jgi:hypothetical protein
VFENSCKSLLDGGLDVKGSEIDLKSQLNNRRSKGREGMEQELGSNDFCAGTEFSAIAGNSLVRRARGCSAADFWQLGPGATAFAQSANLAH